MTIEVNWSTLVVVTIVAVIVFVVVCVALVRAVRRVLRQGTYATGDRTLIHQRWAEVEKLLAQDSEHSLRIAVVEADKLLDYTLKSLVMPGKTLGERLKVATARYPDIERVWWAHKLRNDLVHDSTRAIAPKTLRAAVEKFRSTLKRLGAI